MFSCSTSANLYRRRPVQSEYSLTTFLQAECAAERQEASRTLAKMEDFLCLYISSTIVEQWKWILVTFSTAGWDLWIRALLKIMSKFYLKYWRLAFSGFLEKPDEKMSAVPLVCIKLLCHSKKRMTCLGYDTGLQYWNHVLDS